MHGGPGLETCKCTVGGALTPLPSESCGLRPLKWETSGETGSIAEDLPIHIRTAVTGIRLRFTRLGIVEGDALAIDSVVRMIGHPSQQLSSMLVLIDFNLTLTLNLCYWGRRKASLAREGITHNEGVTRQPRNPKKASYLSKQFIQKTYLVHELR